MNGHDITEHARLLSHRRYAETLDHQPDLIPRAIEMIEAEIRETGGTLGQRLWADVLLSPWPIIRRRMLDDSPEGRLLRSNSPFSTLIGIHDPVERTRLWRLAKKDLLDRTISTGRSAA